MFTVLRQQNNNFIFYISQYDMKMAIDVLILEIKH